MRHHGGHPDMQYEKLNIIAPMTDIFIGKVASWPKWHIVHFNRGLKVTKASPTLTNSILIIWIDKHGPHLELCDGSN